MGRSLPRTTRSPNRAYELYKKSGYRNGGDTEFWLEAEHELRQELISA